MNVNYAAQLYISIQLYVSILNSPQTYVYYVIHNITFYIIKVLSYKSYRSFLKDSKRSKHSTSFELSFLESVYRAKKKYASPWK